MILIGKQRKDKNIFVSLVFFILDSLVPQIVFVTLLRS